MIIRKVMHDDEPFLEILKQEGQTLALIPLKRQKRVLFENVETISYKRIGIDSEANQNNVPLDRRFQKIYIHLSEKE